MVITPSERPAPGNPNPTTIPGNEFDEARQFFLDGVACFESGHFEDAKLAFEASLRLLPGRTSTLSNLGATHLELGQPAHALELLDQALTLEPDDVSAWCHQGQALAALARPAEALDRFDRALALAPGHRAALYQRALMLASVQRLPEALQAADALLALEPANEAALWLRADALNRLDRHAEALAAYDRLLVLNPTLDRAATQRGGLLKNLGRVAEATAAFQQALALGGDPELNQYFLASLANHEAGPTIACPPATAPRSYVEALFDDYADQFDAHLVGLLGYRAPDVLIEELLKSRPAGRQRFQSALDLGCGTGLCGPLVKPNVDRLIGVDLSAAMLDKAQALAVYDTLAHSDLSDHLAQTTQRHDLIVSADVFIYVGALEAVFEGAARVMDVGGVFCFTVEKAHDAVDWQLTKDMRYAHSASYLRRLAAQHGFKVLRLMEHPIRHDQGRAIDGLFVYLLKR